MQHQTLMGIIHLANSNETKPWAMLNSLRRDLKESLRIHCGILMNLIEL